LRQHIHHPVDHRYAVLERRIPIIGHSMSPLGARLTPGGEYLSSIIEQAKFNCELSGQGETSYRSGGRDVI
jgi:hypothetical protein